MAQAVHANESNRIVRISFLVNYFLGFLSDSYIHTDLDWSSGCKTYFFTGVIPGLTAFIV